MRKVRRVAKVLEVVVYVLAAPILFPEVLEVAKSSVRTEARESRPLEREVAESSVRTEARESRPLEEEEEEDE